MDNKCYHHFYANGADARNFLISKEDFYAAFNRIGVCAHNSGAEVVCFSIEDSHPHALLYGTVQKCTMFKSLFVSSSLHYILSTRGSMDGVVLNCSLDPITKRDYLMNVGTYVLVQPTKDGKKVMPYDYLWGSGSMYFRDSRIIPIWRINERGEVCPCRRIGDMTIRERREIIHSKMTVPEDWLVCNGFILPSNYLNVKLFEQIYGTHNCFRTFLTAGNRKMDVVAERMAEVRGLLMDDLEARSVTSEVCMELYGKQTSRWLDVSQRFNLARELKNRYRLSLRQLATLTRLPEEELAKYLL